MAWRNWKTLHAVSRLICTLVVSMNLMVALSSSFHDDDDVLTLTTRNFDTAVAEIQHLFVQFYAPWCRHCKSLESEFHRVATSLRATNIQLAKVDGTVDTELVDRFQVSGFPTLKLFSSSRVEPVDYDGERTARHIISWLRRKTDPGVKQADNVTAVTQFLDSELIVVLGLFPQEDSEFQQQQQQKVNEFMRVADAAGDNLMRFVISRSRSVFNWCNITSDSAVVMFREMDGAQMRLNLTEWTATSMLDMIKRNLLPPVVKFSRDASRLIAFSNIVNHVLLFTAGQSENVLSALDAVSRTATVFRGQLLFIVLDVDDKDSERILKVVDDGARRETLPLIYFVQSEIGAPAPHPQRKYRLDASNLTPFVLQQFIYAVLDGQIEAYVKSETRVDNWNTRSVRVLTGSNFESVIHDSGSHVIVLFYAPWCVHCQRLNPVWHQLADQYASNDQVIVAQIDVTANDISGVEINAFPTIKLFAKDGHTVLDYLEEKTIEKLRQFVDNVVLGSVADSSTATTVRSAQEEL